MSEWQPIETAPKDGTAILVWFEPEVWDVVFWSSQRQQWCQGTGGWGSDRWSDADAEGAHWMPLPDPPQVAR